MGYDLVNKGIQWAIDIIAGDLPSGPLAKLACERFQRDMTSQEDDSWQYYFDADEATRWLDFLTRLKHVKGRWSGQAFDPSGWQCFVVMNLFGWRTKEPVIDEDTGDVTPAGIRRFTDSDIFVPRKNGKSYLVAGLGLGMLTIDGEPGAEVYCGASSEKQAWEVFRPARLMCVRDPVLCGELGIEVNAKALWRSEDGARFEPVIGDPGDGPSPSFSITDEYHEHRNRNQVDTMETGMGARAQPLSLKITTAGSDFGGPCYLEYEECIQILQQTMVDENKFAMIFEADPKVAWDSDEAIRQANPNLGVSVNMRYLQQRRDKARNSAEKQAAYKTKHLNHWVGARQAWMNMLRLQLCVKKQLTLDDFKGREAFGGIDLATRVDIASWCMLIPDPKLGWVVFCRHWAPYEAVYGDNVKNKNYAGWAQAGYINVTDGDTIDFNAIEDQVKLDAEHLDLVDLGYDPYQATQFATNLSDEGIKMVELRPTPINMSEPMMEIEAHVLNRELAYNDPVLTWMFGNVVAKKRGMTGDLVMPDKERPEQKIDGVVALINAANRYLGHYDREGDIDLIVV